MHTINKLINLGLWIFGPCALAILFGFAANSALKSDGIYVGHPRERVVYVQSKQDPRLAQLAAAIDVRRLRGR